MPVEIPSALEEAEFLHFAVGGISTKKQVLQIGRGLELRRLTAFPTLEQLANGVSSLPVAGAMASFGENFIQHELVIDLALFEDHFERIFPTAEALFAGLRVRTKAEILCPAVCELSWSEFPAVPTRRYAAYHFERGHSHEERQNSYPINEEDIEWVRQNLKRIILLGEDANFQTALEGLCTYMMASSERMKIAQLWAGIEAIFDIQHELSYRLATVCAKLLGGSGPDAKKKYKDVKNLYGERSKVIHGKQLHRDPTTNKQKVQQHVNQVRTLLAEILTKLIDREKMLTAEDFEELLFET